MFIVLGGTGHVGSAVAAELLRAGEPVTVVTRNDDKAEAWRARGARAAVADLRDPKSLKAAFRQGTRAFLLNPPAAPSTDTDSEEHRTVASIVQALEGSGLEKVVVESTYGAQPGPRCGDLSVLFAFEQALFRQPVATTALRAAYYMSNWDPLLDAARQGVLPAMFPADLSIPMVAPADLGQAAARLLREPVEHSGIHHVEGPERYTVSDVAAAFATALGRPVEPTVTPRAQWLAAYRELGFSPAAAASYTRMTEVTVDGAYDMPANPERGATSLQHYIAELINRVDGSLAATRA